MHAFVRTRMHVYKGQREMLGPLFYQSLLFGETGSRAEPEACSMT